MTPYQRAEAIMATPDRPSCHNEEWWVEEITTAIQAACNEELERGRARMADAKAALHSALDDLAAQKKKCLDATIERDRYKGAASYVYSTRRRLRLLYEVVTGQPMRVSLSDSEAVDEFDAAVRRLKFDFTVMQDAREELARVKAERDHVAGKLAGCKECGGSGYVVSYAYDGYPEGTPCDHGNVLAAHDRAVAARVLREAEGYIVEPIECSTLLRLADQYERGEREVPA